MNLETSPQTGTYNDWWTKLLVGDRRLLVEASVNQTRIDCGAWHRSLCRQTLCERFSESKIAVFERGLISLRSILYSS